MTSRLRAVTAEGPHRHASQRLDAVERDHIVEVLEQCGWRISGEGNAAEVLGLHPNTLRFRMKRLAIVRPPADRPAER